MLGNSCVDGCDVITCKDGGNWPGLYQTGCLHWLLVAK